MPVIFKEVQNSKNRIGYAIYLREEGFGNYGNAQFMKLRYLAHVPESLVREGLDSKVKVKCW